MTLGGAHSGTRPGATTLRAVVGRLILALLLLATGACWALSSPVASAPDDDYHLASIYCPMRASGPECGETVVNGARAVNVPSGILQTECFRFKYTESAACTGDLDSSSRVRTTRVDAGAYPYGYYQFNHLLVGPTLFSTTIRVRLANVVLAVLGLVLVGSTLPTGQRRPFVLAMSIGWMPMGLYFVASTNPSAWALIGVPLFGACILGAFASDGRRRAVLLVEAAAFAAMAIFSRTDSKILCAVVALAAILLHLRGRMDRRVLLVAGVLGVAGVVTYLTGGQKVAGLRQAIESSASSTATNSLTGPDDSFFVLIAKTMLRFPSYFAGYFGIDGGAMGWLDVTLHPLARYGPLVLFSALMLMGAARPAWSKIASAGMILAFMLVVPAYYMAVKGLVNDGFFESRYLLPLMPFLLFLWMIRADGRQSDAEEFRLTGLQLGIVIAILAVSQSMSLHSVLRRFITGADVEAYNLAASVEWWPYSGFSPNVVWAVASICFVLALVLASLLSRSPGVQRSAPGRVSDSAARH
ncbi:DUF2142 domain-containing protein [Actinomyces culturomici]|uniref:DUF2142 domain-containing protein n=1 Tax=Actinomyces culturomici TaxID=1926276 RepID=UPI000E20265A|nr:DUF2142 domain-containing protein [Actinomyces culturomici]